MSYLNVLKKTRHKEMACKLNYRLQYGVWQFPPFHPVGAGSFQSCTPTSDGPVARYTNILKVIFKDFGRKITIVQALCIPLTV